MASTVLQRLQEPGRQAGIAAAMAVSESTISRLKNDHLDAFCALLAHAGLKIVPFEVKCFREDKVAALLTLAKAHLEQVQTSEALVWE